MASNNLQVQDLDFKDIREQLVEFMRGKPEFTDYDFEGSSLSVLMDMLAYNTHYMGFYGHMLANEAFIDSASVKAAMTSKAKLLNYLPKSKKAAEAVVKFKINIDEDNEPANRKVVIERGTAIQSDNNDSDSRYFVVTDDIIIYNTALSSGEYIYESDEILIYEGTFEQERFIVNDTLLNQRYIIREKNIDITSLQVKVYDSRGDDNFVVFKLADDFMNITGDSPVFFINVNEEEYYEIFFGNGVYGRQVYHQNMVETTFVNTHGALGNNARVFTFNGEYDYNGYPYLIDIETIANAEGGMEPESVEDLRFNIPYHYRRQNRAVTIDDYRNILMSEYRNINSLNIWGGEDHDPVTFGKIFISIKPIYGEVLSSKAKENIIKNIIKKHNVATVEVEIVDPDYLYINLDVSVRYNPVNTDALPGQVMTGCQDAIDAYNTTVLNRYGGFYSDVDLNSSVKKSNRAILTSYTSITIEKRLTPALAALETYYVDFLNEVIPRGIKSDEFEYRLRRSYFTDDGDGNIIIYWYNELKKAWELYPSETFGTIDYMKGQIRLTINFAKLYTQNGILNIYASPKYPDFFTKRNNIVIIDDTRVTVTEDSENENEKV